MGSSGGGGSGRAPNNPAPPASQISPYGQTAPFNPHFTSFLGDTNTPSTGLTPAMLAEINASNGPAPGAAGPPGGGVFGGMPPGVGPGIGGGRPGVPGLTANVPPPNPQRQQLANMMAMQRQSPERGYNIARGRTSGRNLR